MKHDDGKTESSNEKVSVGKSELWEACYELAYIVYDSWKAKLLAEEQEGGGKEDENSALE